MRDRLHARVFFFAFLALALPAGSVQAANESQTGFKVDGKLALSSLISLSDSHLKKVADSLALLALGEAAQSGEWEKIKGPLAVAGRLNVAGLVWFVLPNGAYWSIQDGRAEGNLSSRTYFPKLMQGESILGDLVISKATGKSTAIVAVPIKGEDNKVIGALGVSVYLDQLSEQISKEMGIGEDLIFYSFDSRPLLALEWDPSLIFVEPKKLSPEVSKAFDEMLSNQEGTVRYTFRERKRTVFYKKSGLTNWWYALGKPDPAPESAMR